MAVALFRQIKTQSHAIARNTSLKKHHKMNMPSVSVTEQVLRRSVPIVINSFNQLTYLQSMTEKLRDEGFQNIYIVDQASDHIGLRAWLARAMQEDLAFVLYSPANKGPHDFFLSLKYLQLFAGCPFIYTDPDLTWKRLAPDFISRLFDLAHRYRAFKVGPALEIPPGRMAKSNLRMRDKAGKLISIEQHEAQFWQNQLEPGVFNAPIDTTMHLFLPQYYPVGHPLITGLRVSGEGFDLIHLPWFHYDPMPPDEYKFYLSRSRHTTWRPDLIPSDTIVSAE